MAPRVEVLMAMEMREYSKSVWREQLRSIDRSGASGASGEFQSSEYLPSLEFQQELFWKI